MWDSGVRTQKSWFLVPDSWFQTRFINLVSQCILGDRLNGAFSDNYVRTLLKMVCRDFKPTPVNKCFVLFGSPKIAVQQLCAEAAQLQ